MRRLTTLGLGLALALGPAALAALPPNPITIDVWPGPAPGENGTIGAEKADKGRDGKTVVGITNVTKPTLTVSFPDVGKRARVAVVVCPGGGYNMLAWDHEGEQVARWLNSIGVTAAVLKYRVPRRPDTPNGEPPPQALMDAQRALSLVRSKADDLGVNPKQVGMLGFSAGGHLTASASTHSDQRAYEPVDDADRASCRPDFAVLIYPGGMIQKGSDQLRPEIRVTSQTPPCFFAHAGDDPVSAENSVLMYLALKRAGVSAELHVYASGGHGFGLRPGDKPCATWPQRCEDWLRSQGVLKPAEKR